MSDTNPCLDCGMCCVQFRVSFYWAEADDAPGGLVPAGLTEKLNPHLRCMKGTNAVPRRCVALEGKLGERVACAIYAHRPTPCREFPSHLDDGAPNPKCDQLRAQIGLPPLGPLSAVSEAGRSARTGDGRQEAQRTDPADRFDLFGPADEE